MNKSVIRDLFDDEDSLSRARRMVMRDRWPVSRGGLGGVICPCCDGIAHVYPRKFNRTMARVLVQMYLWDRRQPGEWRHVKNEWPKDNSKFNAEYARMVDYGLIEEPDGVRPDGNPDTGYHRITEAGREFVEGRRRVPETHYCYKNKVIDQSAKTIDISGAIGHPFDYRELFR